MPGAGTTICNKCLGEGSVPCHHGNTNPCTVCDGTGRISLRKSDAMREFDRKEADYIEHSGHRRGDRK